METLKLVRPTEADEARVLDYQTELLRSGEPLHGSGGLEAGMAYRRWLDFDGRARAQYGPGAARTEVFLAIRQLDGRLVGMIEFRHPLTDFARRFGGSVGYGVRPSERRKGYAAEMLRLLLPICRSLGESRVLIACDPDNEASWRTIVRCGGVLEAEIPDTVGLSRSGRIRRYWIALQA